MLASDAWQRALQFKLRLTWVWLLADSRGPEDGIPCTSSFSYPERSHQTKAKVGLLGGRRPLDTSATAPGNHDLMPWCLGPLGPPIKNRPCTSVMCFQHPASQAAAQSTHGDRDRDGRFLFLYGHPYVAEELLAERHFGHVKWRFTYDDDGGYVKPHLRLLNTQRY